jgi:hypothetical protein
MRQAQSGRCHKPWRRTHCAMTDIPAPGPVPIRPRPNSGKRHPRRVPGPRLVQMPGMPAPPTEVRLHLKLLLILSSLGSSRCLIRCGSARIFCCQDSSSCPDNSRQYLSFRGSITNSTTQPCAQTPQAESKAARFPRRLDRRSRRRLSAAAEARSAGTGWPAPDWTSRSAARRSGSWRNPERFEPRD